MKEILMHTSESYRILVENGLLNNISKYIKEVYDGSKIYIITDTNVKKYYLETVKDNLKDFEVYEVVVPSGEKSKSFKVYENVLKQLLELNMRRGELIIALGGGVIGDLSGFVAGTLFRGTPYINIPTSLLSMVDSSIGGKTAIDFLGHKNIVGVFNQPKLVLIDPKTLDTLPRRQLKNGYGEIIKHALIESPQLWELINKYKKDYEEIIYQNLLIKQKYVEEDEFDQNMRMKLNFGHTFGHVLEFEYNMLHGEAVLSGILCALDLGVKLNVTNPNLKDEVLNLYNKLKLNYKEVNYLDYVSQILSDKKNIKGSINFILVKEIGDSLIFPIDEKKLWN